MYVNAYSKHGQVVSRLRVMFYHDKPENFGS